MFFVQSPIQVVVVEPRHGGLQASSTDWPCAALGQNGLELPHHDGQCFVVEHYFISQASAVLPRGAVLQRFYACVTKLPLAHEKLSFLRRLAKALDPDQRRE